MLHSDLDMENSTNNSKGDMLFHIRRKRLQRIDDNENMTEKAEKLIKDLNEVWEKVFKEAHNKYVV